MSAKPLCVDLYAGLGGWAEGALSAGYEVVGFDNGHTAPYATGARYPSQLGPAMWQRVSGRNSNCREDLHRVRFVGTDLDSDPGAVWPALLIAQAFKPR